MDGLSQSAPPSLIQGRHVQVMPSPPHVDGPHRTAALLPQLQEPGPGTIINKIEDILHSIQLDLLHQRELTIAFRTRPRIRRVASLGDEVNNAPRLSTVRFPGTRPQEAKKFARLLKLLQLIHEALTAGTLLTKRNIFYQDVELFGSQAVVDQLVDDLAYTLGFGRSNLNVATFRSLSVSRYGHTCSSGPGILITGKGYPDLSTRAFLHALHGTRPDLSIFAVVDFDPDGLRIMRCYKIGSTSLDHEENLQVPSIKWLGVKSSDIFSAHSIENSPRSPSPTGEGLLTRDSGATNLVPLTPRDRKSAQKLLNSIEEDGIDMEDVECRRELQVMLFLGIKGEIQGVDNAGDLAGWLDKRIEESLH